MAIIKDFLRQSELDTSTRVSPCDLSLLFKKLAYFFKIDRHC